MSLKFDFSLRGSLLSPLLLWMVCMLGVNPLHAQAVQSLKLSPGVTGTFTVPSVSPFPTMGSSRVEMRIHDFTIPTQNTLLFETPVLRIELRPAGELCAQDTLDGMYSYGNYMCADITGKQDLTLRLQRNIQAGQLQFEVMETQTGAKIQTYCGTLQISGNGNLFHCPLAPVINGSWAGSGRVGGTTTNTRVAWIKWHSTVVALNSGVPTSYAPADLADWSFEGNGQDTPNPLPSIVMNISIPNYPNNPNNYPSTPVYPPVPKISTFGAPDWTDVISMRAGYPGRLDASGSYSLTNQAPTRFNWTQLDGPSKLIFDDPTSAQPEVRGMVFGTYKVNVQVVDDIGTEANTEFSFGAVATDSKGVVITNNPEVDKIMGPMIAFGRNPWTWADSRHKYLADFFGGLLSTSFSAPWRTFKSGTVTVTNNDATLTGIGTNFAAELDCSSTDSYLAIEYPDPTTPTGFAYKGFKVVPGSCTATTLTMNARWAATPGTTSGLRYANFGLGGWFTWVNGGTNPNYYDNVLAHYALYYRSGMTRYRDYARTLADTWFEHPFFDYGRGAGAGDITMNGAPRLLSLTGLTLRALDGQEKFWSHLRGQFSYHLTFQNRTDPFQDMREDAYTLQSVILGALFDPDLASRNTYRSGVISGLRRWKNQQVAGRGNWTNEYPSEGSFVIDANDPTKVTGQGLRAALCENSWVRFDNENFGYRCTFVSPTEIRLNRPYIGTPGTKRMQFGNLVGRGTQPFVLGLASNIVAFSRNVVEPDPSQDIPDGLDMGAKAMDWMEKYGFYEPAKGLFYGREFAGCETGNGGPAGAPLMVRECKDSGDGEGAMRAFAGEALGAFARIYPSRRFDRFKNMGDALYTANFGKPGFGLPEGVTNPEGYFNSEADNNGATVSRGKAKDYGFFWGFGLASSWPAARLGGAEPESLVDTQVESFLSGTAGAVTARITVTQPSGKKDIKTCQSDSCTVQVDTRQGTHLARIEFLNSSDEAIGDPKEILIELP